MSIDRNNGHQPKKKRLPLWLIAALACLIVPGILSIFAAFRLIQPIEGVPLNLDILATALVLLLSAQTAGILLIAALQLVSLEALFKAPGRKE